MKHMKKLLLIIPVMPVLTACGQDTDNKQEAAYRSITPRQAKAVIDWPYEVERNG